MILINSYCPCSKLNTPTVHLGEPAPRMCERCGEHESFKIVISGEDYNRGYKILKDAGHIGFKAEKDPEPVVPYTHDCDKCHFVGHLHDTANHQLDIYICLKSWGDASLVIRHGNDGPDYWSYPVFGLHKMMEEAEE